MPRRDRQPRDPMLAVGASFEGPDLDVYRAFVEGTQRGDALAMVTVVGESGSVPRGMGAAMVVHADGRIVGTVGGGQLEQLVTDHALEAIRDGRPRLYHYDFSGGRYANISKSCMGQSHFFIQPAPVVHRLYIFGAGHIGATLAPMAVAAGFAVTLLDERPGYPVSPDALAASGVSISNGRSYGSVFADDPLVFCPQSTFIVLVNHDTATDERVLAPCLARPWRYLGMIGSRSKVVQVFRRQNLDETCERQLERVHAPIGLALGGRSPGEIAVSIVAELVAVRHQREGQPVESISVRRRPKPSSGRGRDRARTERTTDHNRAAPTGRNGGNVA